MHGKRGMSLSIPWLASWCALPLLGLLLLAPTSALAQAQGDFILPQIGSGSPAYRFNEDLSVFEKAPDSLGPLVAEGARSVGRHQLFVSLLYTHIDVSEIEGIDFDFGTFRLGIVDLIAEFGVTERIEVTVNLPIVRAEVEAAGIDSTGIGDIRFRSKWNFLQSDDWMPDMATQLQVQVPSGDDNNARGTGLGHFSLALIASDTWFDGWVSPHVNWDIEITTEDDETPGIGGQLDFWNTKWVLGTDAHLHERVNVSVDLLARHKLVDDFDGGAHILDLAFGTKVIPSRVSTCSRWCSSRSTRMSACEPTQPGA